MELSPWDMLWPCFTQKWQHPPPSTAAGDREENWTKWRIWWNLVEHPTLYLLLSELIGTKDETPRIRLFCTISGSKLSCRSSKTPCWGCHSRLGPTKSRLLWCNPFREGKWQRFARVFLLKRFLRHPNCGAMAWGSDRRWPVKVCTRGAVIFQKLERQKVVSSQLQDQGYGSVRLVLI